MRYYVTPSGGSTSAPVNLKRSANNQYTFTFSSDISGSCETGFHICAHKTKPSIMGDNMMDDKYGSVTNGATKTFTVTIPPEYNYVHIQAWGSIVNGSYVDVPDLDGYFKLEPLDNYFAYGVNGAWKDVTPLYCDNGVWKPCTPYYGVGGAWKELNK